MLDSKTEPIPYYEDVRRYAVCCLGDWNEANDVAQETLLRYLNSGKKLEGLQLRNYLYKTARNYMIDLFRHRNLVNKVCDTSGEQYLQFRSDDAPEPRESAERNEMCSIVQEKIRELPPTVQEILRLRYNEQMKTRDIAYVTGKSHGNIRRILSETIAALEKKLNPNDPLTTGVEHA